MKSTAKIQASLSLLVVSASLFTQGCSKHSDRKDGAQPGAAPETAAAAAAIIAIDGSSTVFPVTEAVAEEFQKKHPAKVTIGVSGTGGGFKKFCKGEVAVTGASRPIKPSEVELCGANKIQYVELPVAYDGIAVVVHPKNTWTDKLTVAELKRMWEPEAQGKVAKWHQVRTGFPEKELHLFGAGVDSGTYDYFTKAIVGEEHKSRGDFTSSEDDNVLVHGVSTDQYALGFFGFAYYSENKDKLKLVPVDDENEQNGAGAIAPSPETVADGTYQPLSRPIFIYVNEKEAKRPEIDKFITYYLNEGSALVKETGYIPLTKSAVAMVLSRFQKRVTGSVFVGEGSQVGVTVEKLLGGK